ncbi:hypothetical protein [Streptomyces sp. NPDC056544]|uniref:hypothetical protein n=1 Tax=unclassified Streptomyces TaxID=2593676 RepID=UPI00367DBB73
MSRINELPTSRLDHFLPEWHFHEYHSVTIDARPDVVMAAARAVTWREAPLARVLMSFTKIKIVGDRPILDDFAMDGHAVLELTDDELVYGGISNTHGPIGLQGPAPDAYPAFGAPGHTKSAFNLRFANNVLSTETRLFFTDTATLRSFRPYWTFIRLPSGLVRRALLRAIRNRALRR